ncbi:MAG: serpin family protein [Candidatus Thorarchaeota archaeon]
MTELNTSLCQNITDFAIDLFHQLRSQKGNLFFSPFSIATALTLAYAGAKGTTASQMEQGLRLTLPAEDIHPAYQALMAQLHDDSATPGFKLKTANALWVQEGLTLLQKYLDMINKYYGKAIFSLNFQDTEQACNRINGWVKELSNGLITNLVTPAIVAAFTALVITNAIYFKGLWASQFKEGNTQNAPFTLISGNAIQVPMMYQKGEFGYFEDPQFQMLEVPYQGQQLSMVILLPHKSTDFTDFEAKVSSHDLSEWLSNIQLRQVRVYLPRYKLLTELELGAPLKNLGIIDAFSEVKADFSGISEISPLFISAVLHTALIEVNEEGTEAAAATAVIMAPRGIGTELAIPVFRANRPFLFLIRDIQTNTVLFMGRMITPK